MFPEPVSPDLGTFFLPGILKKERVIERNTTVIHLYKSNGFNMVLDVNSGSVHVVDDCVYDVLSCMNEGKNAEETAEALSSKYAEQDITEAREEIQELADNGMLFTKDGIMNMRNKKWENDYSPIEADGASYVDTMYSRAYLRHLFHAQELLAMQIASIHNLAFYLWLVGEARKHIIAGDFSTWKPAMVKRLSTRL